MFKSLRQRNFRLFFAGQLVSNSGTWMQNVALAWLVLQISHSAFDVGLISALQFLPSLLLGAYGGVVADRFPKRRTLVITQSGMALAATALAGIYFWGDRSLTLVYMATGVSGAFQAFDTPVRQAFVSEMVGQAEIANAVSLNSALFNVSRVAGSAMGAGMIEILGVGACFSANAVSFVAVIVGLLSMRPSELYPSKRVPKGRGQIREGLRYIWSTPELKDTIGLLVVVGTLAMNFQTVLPVFAERVLHGGAGAYGVMTAVMGGGSVIGALMAAARRRPTEKHLLGSAMAFGALMIGDAVAPGMVVLLPILCFTGVASISYMVTSNSRCQLASTPHMRGRVMAVYSVVFLGSTPIGGPLIGWIDQVLGARWGLLAGGVPTLLAAGALTFLTIMRSKRSRSPVASEEVIAEVAPQGLISAPAASLRTLPMPVPRPDVEVEIA